MARQGDKRRASASSSSSMYEVFAIRAVVAVVVGERALLLAPVVPPNPKRASERVLHSRDNNTHTHIDRAFPRGIALSLALSRFCRRRRRRHKSVVARM